MKRQANPGSGFFVYLWENSAECRRELAKTIFPGEKLPQQMVCDELKQRWNNLSEDVREVYQERARDNFQKKPRKQKKPKVAVQAMNPERYKAMVEGRLGLKKKRLEPKKPPSAYNLFVKDRFANIRESLTEKERKKPGAAFKKLGSEWKALPDAKRAEYEEEARKHQAQYQVDVESYIARHS